MRAADCGKCEASDARRHAGDGPTMLPADAPPGTGTTVRMRNVAPDDRVADVIALAALEHLQVVTNGSRFALCSVIPAGWRPFGHDEYSSGTSH